MNQKPNAIKVTLDDGKSFIVQDTNTPNAIARLRRLGKISPSGYEVAYVAKIHYDFTEDEVIR